MFKISLKYLSIVLGFKCVTYSALSYMLFVLKTIYSTCLSSFFSFFVVVVYIWAHSPQPCLHHRNHHVDSHVFIL